jgi:hypothetical protein
MDTNGLPQTFRDTSRSRDFSALDGEESGFVMAGNGEKGKKNLSAIG